MIFFLGVVLLFQQYILDNELQEWATICILITIIIISIIIALKVVKWQNRLLDSKSIKTNYIVLVILILLTVILIPTPMKFIVT
jgi:hypothetical protein